MDEVGASADVIAVAVLVAVSFFSFVVGLVFRKWPDKIQDFAESIDGSVLLLTPQAHRALIEMSGLALLFMSMAALLAAAFAV